jgi:serine/threonine protein kinase
MDKIQEQWPEWQTVELVGEGTFGSVYKAKKEVYGNISYAAIKVIEIPKEPREIRDLQQSDMDESSIKAFYEDMIHNLMSEIQIMESMKSANGIVGIEDYKVVQREPLKWEVFIRMEFLEDLQTYLDRHPMTGCEVVQLGMDLCESLKNCEIAGIVHRDVKIDNVFVNRFGSFKLGDFGIAKQLGKTRAAMSQKGTNMYMAPEIFRGEPYDARVDIYSLGILLYRLLNKGRFPFMPLWPNPIKYSDDQKATFQRISGKSIPAIPDIPTGLSEIVCRACAYDKENRYQKAEDLAKDLEKYINSEELTEIVTKGNTLKEMETPSDSDITEASENKETDFTEQEEQKTGNFQQPEVETDHSKKENLFQDEKTYAAFEEPDMSDSVLRDEKPDDKVIQDFSDEKTYAAFDSMEYDYIHNGQAEEQQKQDRFKIDPKKYGHDTEDISKEKDTPPVNRDMPMKWYKFVVNFQLPLSLLYYVFLLYRYISGSVYGGADVANNIYALAPALRRINYYLDAVNAITLVGAVIVMIWMKRFKTNAWKYYIGLLVGNAVAVVLYLIMYCIVIQTNANFTNSSLTQYVITITNTIWTTGLMGVINYIYFKKRDHLFTN